MVKKIEEKYLTLPEVKDILEKYQEESSTMQINTLEYVRKLSKVSSEDAERILNELKKIANLKETTYIQLINIFPETIEEIRSIVMYEEKLLGTEILKKILEVFEKYRKRNEE